MVNYDATFVDSNGGENLVLLTVSGHPGSGTSTLVNSIAKEMNWKFINGGIIFREEAKKRNLTLKDFEELCQNNHSIDTELDELLKDRMLDELGPQIIESRLAGWWAYNFEISCIRIWIDVSPEERARRVLSREGGDLASKIKENKDRLTRVKKRFQKLYGLDPEDEAPYTHVLHTDKMSKEQVHQSVMSILKDV